MTGWDATPDLEGALRSLGGLLDYPSGSGVARVVVARIATAPRRSQPRSWRVAAVAVAAAVAVLAATLALSAGARRAVAGWLGVGGDRIRIVPTVPSAGPLGSELNLGPAVSLAQARLEAGFRIAIPSRLGTPDAIHLRTGLVQDQVWLVYRTRPGIQPAEETGVAVLVSEFPGEVDEAFMQKLIDGGTSLQRVRVNGTQGFWLSGAPHQVAYLDPKGRPVEDLVRLAGNVLVWDEGRITFRIEADVSLQEALAIAASMR